MYPSDLKYTKDHEWVRVEGRVGAVGITHFAQQQLGDVVYIDLPEVGASLTLGQPFGTIESVKAVSELFAPVSGTVTEVNTAIKDRPDAVNSAPHDTWMIKVELANPSETEALLGAAEYEASLAH